MYRKPRTGLPLVALALLFPAVAQAHPPASSSQPSMEQFIRIKWPRGGRLTPDGRFYYVYNPKGIYQLYRTEPNRGLASSKQLTFFSDGVSGGSLSRDGRQMLVTAATGGSEQNDLYLLDTGSDKLTELFVDPNVVYGSTEWRRDSQAFAYRANDRSSRDFHVYLYDIRTGKHRPVFAEEGSNYPADFNAAGSKLVVGRYNSASHTQLFEIDLASSEKREITPTDEEWAYSPVGYTADEKRFLVISDYRGDLRRLHAIDLKSGKVEPLLPELSEHNVDFATFNEDRSILAVATNEDGYRRLHLYDAAQLAPVPMPNIPEGLVGNVNFTGPHMLYSVTNANTPGIIYRWNTREPQSEPVALTKADTQGIDVSRFQLPKLVHYPSFDGREIPAFVYLPAGYQKGTPIPFIAYYHGGPESQYRPGFRASIQYFLSRGFGVIAPNPRGSSGYGKAYLEADNYKNRMVSVKDGIWAAKYLVDQGYSKPEMIGAYGGSYGGFMVMAVITEAPELFGAAANVVGICNFQTFLEQTKDYRRHLREAEYGPLSDPEFLRSISPIYRVDRIKTPLLLAHGLNDPRVPIGEALQIAVELIRRDHPVRQLYFPDEGHGFRKEPNRILFYTHLADFFEEYLHKHGP